MTDACVQDAIEALNKVKEKLEQSDKCEATIIEEIRRDVRALIETLELCCKASKERDALRKAVLPTLEKVEPNPPPKALFDKDAKK